MKIRVGFVANSSSSSFVASEDGEDAFLNKSISSEEREIIIWFPVSPEDRLEEIYENSNDNS